MAKDEMRKEKWKDATHVEVINKRVHDNKLPTSHELSKHIPEGRITCHLQATSYPNPNLLIAIQQCDLFIKLIKLGLKKIPMSKISCTFWNLAQSVAS